MIKRLSESESELMLKFYERQEKIIKAKLEEAVKNGNNQVALKKLFNQIQSANSQLKIYFKNYSQMRLPLIYENSASKVDKAVKAFDLKFDKESAFNRLDERTINLLAKNTYESLETINTVIGRTAQDYLRDLGLKQTQGVVFGTDSWQKVAKDMTEQLKNDKFFTIPYKNGAEVPAKAYSEMVARTTSAEAFRAGTRDRIQEHGYDLVDVIGHSSNPNSPCIPYEDTTLSLTGETNGYISLDEAVANNFNHPNCIHDYGFSDENLKLIDG